LSSLTLPNEWRYRIMAYLVAPENGLPELERKRRHAQAKLKRLKQLFQDGDYTLEEYSARKIKLEVFVYRVCG